MDATYREFRVEPCGDGGEQFVAISALDPSLQPDSPADRRRRSRPTVAGVESVAVAANSNTLGSDIKPEDLERYRRELTGYCYRMLGSGFEAEDAVQDTMVRAWKALDSFEGRSAVRSWLYRIATNVCLDMLRGRQRRARPMEMGPSSPADPAHLGPLLAFGRTASRTRRTAGFAMAGLDRSRCCVGHTHIPATFRVGDAKVMINPGSVGQPRDGDERASYAIFDPEGHHVWFYRVAYDVRQIERDNARRGIKLGPQPATTRSLISRLFDPVP